MDQLRGHSITYRIAVGPQQGRKVFTLQTLPDERDADAAPAVGNVAGFSLHAGVAARANQRRLCRYIARPAIAEKRLPLTKKGMVRCELKTLKTPYRDGTTHVIFEPVDFAAPAHPCARGIHASMHIIACTEDPVVISKILKHLQAQSPLDSGVLMPNPRAPPQASLFG